MPLVRLAIQSFGLEECRMIDCFSTDEDARFEVHWTQAESMDWDAAGAAGWALWLNPPFSLWDKFCPWVLRRTAPCVCVVPSWRENWVQELLNASSRQILLPSGSIAFEVHGRPVGPLPWHLWIMMIHMRHPSPSHRTSRSAESESEIREDGQATLTSSARRRRRRRRLIEARLTATRASQATGSSEQCSE